MYMVIIEIWIMMRISMINHDDDHDDDYDDDYDCNGSGRSRGRYNRWKYLRGKNDKNGLEIDLLFFEINEFPKSANTHAEMLDFDISQ